MKSIFDKEFVAIIARLKKERLKTGLSQNDLANKLGVSQSYISKLEQGQVRVDIIQLKRVLQVLGLKLEDVVK